ncbi:hypothetical protein PF002_g7485 [Phytophthora fragariae]|uniref:Uncharacterized protein n=1 Tax=Phytophthora fragariae TaxID=53985 RepID=A0A6A3UDY3_9STRA|nr:hypothetical protein PF003_g26563 [Phytophthora fragariae]KAE8947641.1 hypothetical protein PF009_g2769 [Phytophthora fragariae]KAE9149776.1 hypothetical protein PF006_g5770 [Phytophthora fragariae]KAE9244984.1 hypothetical protein PF002_g7485 [Phytophthora fragariae]KAE9319712.1 hypothetical protein PF001_g5755 [Phytophthora fragariae]
MASLSSRSLLQRASRARFPLALSCFHSNSGSLRTRAAERSQAGPSTPPCDAASPQLSGLTRLGHEDTRASVRDLIEAVRHADASLKTVEVATPDGTKLARTVRLSELTAMSFCLCLNHVNVLVEGSRSSAGMPI